MIVTITAVSKGNRMVRVHLFQDLKNDWYLKFSRNCTSLQTNAKRKKFKPLGVK